MKLFIILLFVSYVSAGVITGFTTSEKLAKEGNVRSAPIETKTIHNFPAGGRFIAYIVPYSNRNKNNAMTYAVEIIWENPKEEKYSLDILTVNWPNSDHKISAVESLIHPKSIDKKLTITIKYTKLSGFSTRTYKYNSKKNTYTAY